MANRDERLGFWKSLILGVLTLAATAVIGILAALVLVGLDRWAP